ncbi:hypothetical protein QUB63_30320 [Microcoleus sp. ARI1-B5]|uniref:hypothetical protein n=1 Tax=unclassified Microcoleus TaxID=2642155 RepID=UPI002FD2A479
MTFDEYRTIAQLSGPSSQNAAQPRGAIFSGTRGNDAVTAQSAPSQVAGVELEARPEQGQTALLAKNTGAGEVDTLIGSPGRNFFILGAPQQLGGKPQPFYVGQGDRDYALIKNFDPKKDFIQLANDDSDLVMSYIRFADKYSLETVNGNTRISTKAGDLVAIVEGVTELKPFTGYTPPGNISLVSLENKLFSNKVQPTFYEPWYREFDTADYNSSAQKAVEAGVFKNIYDQFLNLGQYEFREDDLFAANTVGNNTVYGFGYESGNVGVPITAGVYTRDVKPVNTGVGEVDILIGSPGENTFFLGNAAILNQAPQPFYVGQGDNDYALIKDLANTVYGVSYGEKPEFIANPEDLEGVDPTTLETLIDRLMLAGRAFDYDFEQVGSDLRISTLTGDLVAIIEGNPPIDVPYSIPGGTYVYGVGNTTSFDSESFGSEARFWEPFYLEENPGVAQAVTRGEYASAFEHYVKVGQFNKEKEVIFAGTSEDNFVAGFGGSDLLFGVPITSLNRETGAFSTETTGVGEADFLLGGLGDTTYFIGNDNLINPSKGAEVWYVGEGDKDYVSIMGFDPYKDFLFTTGKFEDYSFEVVGKTDDIFGRQVPYKSLEVSYKQDLVAVLEYIDGGLTVPEISLQPFSIPNRPNALALAAPQNQLLR